MRGEASPYIWVFRLLSFLFETLFCSFLIYDSGTSYRFPRVSPLPALTYWERFFFPHHSPFPSASWWSHSRRTPRCGSMQTPHPVRCELAFFDPLEAMISSSPQGYPNSFYVFFFLHCCSIFFLTPSPLFGFVEGPSAVAPLPAISQTYRSLRRYVTYFTSF